MLRKICLGLLACSTFAGAVLVETDAEARLFRRARRRATTSYSSASCCTPTNDAYYGQPVGGDMTAPPAPYDPNAPQPSPASPGQPPQPAPPPGT